MGTDASLSHQTLHTCCKANACSQQLPRPKRCFPHAKKHGSALLSLGHGGRGKEQGGCSPTTHAMGKQADSGNVLQLGLEEHKVLGFRAVVMGSGQCCAPDQGLPAPPSPTQHPATRHHPTLPAEIPPARSAAI